MYQNVFSKYKQDFNSIITNDDNMKELIKKAQKVSLGNSPILIYGETGVGKEIFVQAIHNNSLRKDKKILALNCAAIPANLMEAMLFGIEKGSFTGALDRVGLLESVNEGTLYLDELNSMPIELQGKLLRVIEENTIKRVGNTSTIDTNIRFICSFNEDPESCISRGTIRKDLYYRLNVIRLNIPPLRKRKEDIYILIDYFIKKYNNKFNGNIKGITKEAMHQLLKYDWPGNVRELENSLEALFNYKSQGFFEFEDLKNIDSCILCMKRKSLKERVEEVEKEYIKEALIIGGFNITKAAEILDIPRQTLQYKIKKYRLDE